MQMFGRRYPRRYRFYNGILNLNWSIEGGPLCMLLDNLRSLIFATDSRNICKFIGTGPKRSHLYSLETKLYTCHVDSH